MASSRSSSASSSSVALTTPPDIEMEGIPTVTLESADIDHAMAARLTIALLGHMLYMKGQVPFPVQSIARMAQHEATEEPARSRTAMRAARKRTDFLQSFDDLTSHLHTTFVALSTALALNEANNRLALQPAPSPLPTYPPAKVHILLILGPSPSSAKTRVLLELDGLHIEKFGEEELLRRAKEEGSTGWKGVDNGSDSNGDDSVECSYAAGTEAVNVSVPSSPLHRPWIPPPDLAYTAFTLQPQTPSHNPSSSTHSSDAESPPSSQSSENSFSDIDESIDVQARHEDSLNPLALAQRAEEAALRTGERLLSRTLFAAGEGLGFGDEISPTQAHILIRAPRRLAHPTWIPRQNLGSSLDRHVKRFLDMESRQIRTDRLRGKGAFGAGVPTVGVRVTCRGAETTRDDSVDAPQAARSGGEKYEEDDDDDDDELIWWSWDGKLVGFAD